MQKSIFLFICVLFVACKKTDDFQFATTYEGSITYITERTLANQTFRDTFIYQNFVLVLGDEKFRRFSKGNKGCKGDFTLTDTIFTATTEDCACMCGCNPNFDCRGDLILGTFEVLENSAQKLIIKNIFENDFGGVGYYRSESFINLDRQ